MPFIADIPGANTMLICTHRCGHTSMAEYLGFLPLYNYPHTLEIADFNNPKNKHRRIVVLRNHYQRCYSAVKFVKNTPHTIALQAFGSIEAGITGHRQPYLHELTQEFEYIDFNRYSEYNPINSRNTARTLSNHRKVTPKMLAEIGYTVTDEDRREQERYEYFKRNYREISPEDWKVLIADRVESIHGKTEFPEVKPFGSDVIKTHKELKKILTSGATIAMIENIDTIELFRSMI